MTERDDPTRLRIAFPLDGLYAAGAERQMLELARRLPVDRFRVSFLLRIEPGPMAPLARDAGIAIWLLGGRRRHGTRPAGFVAATARSLGSYLQVGRRERFDIVDAWLYPFYDLAAIAAPISGRPAVIAGRRSLSTFKDRFTPLQRRLDRWATSRARVVVANSEAVRRDVVARERIAPHRVTVIRNGVALAPLLAPGERDAIRSRWGAEPTSTVIGCVANFRPGKGHQTLITAFAAAAAPRSDLRLVLVGDGPERPSIEDAISRAGLTGRVMLHGADPDPRRLAGAFDIGALASTGEGLPNALLEAAAASVPLVSTAAGGAVEVAIDGETGFVVPVDDVAAFATALGRMADDSELRARLGRAGRLHVATSFGMDRFVREYARLYERVAALRSGGSTGAGSGAS